jgi:hypothetical protein
MRLQVLLAVVMSLAIAGCKNQRYSHLKKENDSLRAEIEARHQTLMMLHNAEVLLDTIEMNMRSREDESEILPRLEAVCSYVKVSEESILKMQKELQASRYEANAYLMMVDALKGELGVHIDKSDIMEDSVGGYVSSNAELVTNLSMQERMILDLKRDIEHRHQQLNKLEQDVTELEAYIDISDAEREYARAQRVELIGRKMLLSPQKKRETMREALEIYKKAYVLGKKEARENIAVLEDAL